MNLPPVPDPVQAQLQHHAEAVLDRLIDLANGRRALRAGRLPGTPFNAEADSQTALRLAHAHHHFDRAVSDFLDAVGLLPHNVAFDQGAGLVFVDPPGTQGSPGCGIRIVEKEDP